MKVTFIQFAKRQNSTKQPTSEELAAGIVYEAVYLKALTNIDNPVLMIDGVDSNIYAYNYAYIEDWGRYYFVSSCDLNNEHICKINLELDDLATYKSFIQATDAYVVYSSSDYNIWIRDDRTPIVARPPEVEIARGIPMIGDDKVFEYDSLDESVILTTFSKDTGVTYWRMSELTIDTLMNSLITAGASIWGSMQLLFGDAIGSIISAVRLPINTLVIPTDGVVREVWLGDYKVQTGSSSYLEAMKLSQKYIRFRKRVGIPTTYLDYRVFEPYVELKIRLPFVGVCDISHQEFGGSVYVEGVVDLCTGKIVYTLYNDENYTYAVCNFNGQCGGTMPMASSQISKSSEIVQSLASSAISLGAAAINPALGIAGSIGSIASAFYHANQKSTNILGSYAGMNTEVITTDIEVIAIKHETAIEPSNLKDIEGRPCMKCRSISGLTGFVRTQGFSIELAVNKSVIDSINAKMDAGVYIE